MRLDEWRPAQTVEAVMTFGNGERVQLWTSLAAVRTPDGEPVWLGYGPAGKCLPGLWAFLAVKPAGTRMVVMTKLAPCGHSRFVQAEQTMQ